MQFKYILILIAALAIGCNDEDDIHPRQENEMSFQLPQGEHDYDEIIVDWYNNYKFYTLYKFTDRDIYWNNTQWEQGFMPGVGGNLLGKPADPDFVGYQLDLLQQSLFDLYPDSLLAYMPLKVLLCSELWKTDYVFDYTVMGSVKDSTAISAYKGFDYFAMNGGNKGILTITPDDKIEMQTALNALFLDRLCAKGMIVMPEKFATFSDYTYKYYGGEELFKHGFLSGWVLQNGDKKASIANDFASFMKLVALPLKVLEAEPDIGSGTSNDPSLTGALNESRDVNKLVRKKYEVLVEYLKDLGIDMNRMQYPEFK